jgi:iron complex transport system ATP-binding protein
MDPSKGKNGGILVSLVISDLSVKYGLIKALSNITLEVEPGEIVALVGPNGAGKSSLIRAISGVLPINTGDVHFGEHKISALSYAARARILGVVPQARQLGGAFTVHQTVMLGRTAYMGWLGKARAEDLAAVKWAMEQTSVLKLAHRKNAELSGGEQQRVLLARALAQQTPVLLLDEPTNHLDLQYQISFLKLLRELTRQENLTVLMAMHDLNQVSTYADRVVFLVDGEILALGEPEDVLTVENIISAYNIPVEIISHPKYGTPLILPKRE